MTLARHTGLSKLIATRHPNGGLGEEDTHERQDQR